MSAHPTLAALLDVLATLDEDVLSHVYSIERGNTAPLDAALYAWRDAGCPGAPGDEEPAPTPSDARAILGNGAFYAYYDCGVGERIDGRPRPTREGPEGDAMRVGWDEQDARLALAEDRDGGATCAAPTVRAKVAAARLRWAAMCAIQVEDVPHMNGDEDAGRCIGDEDCEGEPDTCGRSYDHGYEQAMRGEVYECGRASGHSGPCGRPERCGDEDDGAPDAAGECGGVR